MNLDQIRGYVDEIEATPLNVLMAHASADMRAMLLKSLNGQELTTDEGLAILYGDRRRSARCHKAADLARAEDVGEEVTYVVNRNINFTNICFVGCQFCGFKRQKWESDAYDHSDETIVAKVADAIARGATEICMQGGINPDMPAFKYRDLLVAIKAHFPDIHIHAFSPMEIMYGARRTRMDYSEYIAMLRDAGLGSIPGTAAEILDDERPRNSEPQESRCRGLGRYHHDSAHALGVPHHFDDHVRPSGKPAPRDQSSRLAARRSRSARMALPSSCPCASSTKIPCSSDAAW